MVLSLALLIVFVPMALAQSAGAEESGRIAVLERRIRDLERQNREILRALEQLQAAVSASAQPASSHAAVAQEQAPPAGHRDGRSISQPLHRNEIVAGNSRVRLYGFLRLDAIADSSIPDKAQTPFFIRSPDAQGGGDSNLTMHPRLTRLGLDLTGPVLERAGGAKIGGKFEVDFQNGGRESRPIIRIRHAYLAMHWPSVSLLAGQTWDLISPLYPSVNNDTLMWNAGNLGDRRPQIRLSNEREIGTGTFTVAGALALTGAVDAQDLDGNGTRDGERSAAPNIQVRMGYHGGLWRDDPDQLSAGLWGLYSWEKTDMPVAGGRSFDGQAVGADVRLTLTKRMRLSGEGWWGHNLDDFRGGINQGVSTETGREIESTGGWAELSFDLRSGHTVYGGYTVDDPRDGQVPAGGRVRNYAWYIGNRQRLGKPFLVGIDYLRWTTNFAGLRSGTDNRVNAYVQYDF